MNTVLARPKIASAVAFVITLLAASTLQGCSSASVRTMPEQDGTIRIVAKAPEKTDAEEAANEKALDYCKDRGQEAVFLKDGTKYTGDMNEQTRDTVKKASTAAQILGGFNSPVSDAGTAGHVMTSGKDYEAEVVFKCRGSTASN